MGCGERPTLGMAIAHSDPGSGFGFSLRLGTLASNTGTYPAIANRRSLTVSLCKLPLVVNHR